MSPFDLAAFLFAAAGLFAYLNYRWLRLPPTIGILLLALAATMLLTAIDVVVPGVGLRAWLAGILDAVDLPQSLLDGFLAFLLFAGALHVDINDLLSRKWTIIVLSTFGVLLSTALFGLGLQAVCAVAGVPVAPIYCFVFGALISPTDPVATLGLLRRVGVPTGLQATIAGESMFNDGIGIVIFSLLLGAATRGTGLDPLAGLVAFVREAGGAVALGLVTGGVTFALMRRIDEYNVELLLAVGLASGTYAAAQEIGVSGPIAVVVAGLLIGNQGIRHAMSETTARHLRAFWGFVDEALNATLFLLIGLEIVAVKVEMGDLAAAALSIPLALVVRSVSVAIPALPLHLHTPRKSRAIALLTWSGLRGGISIALALSLPAGAARDHLLPICYAVVLFTTIVQGLTVEPLAARLFPRQVTRRRSATPGWAASSRGEARP